MNNLIITTQLKTTDAVAATAFQTLCSDLKLGKIVKALNRFDLWFIELKPDSTEDIYATGISLATKTRVFVNPNKHAYSIFTVSDVPQDIEKIEDSVYRCRIVVREMDDARGRTAQKDLQNLYDQDVVKIQFCVMWRIDIKAESEEQARDLAWEIAVTKTQTQGLLANPHSQISSFISSLSK